MSLLPNVNKLAAWFFEQETPLQVSSLSLKIHGLTVKTEFLLQVLQPITNAKTPKQLNEALQLSQKNLELLNMFENIEFTIDDQADEESDHSTVKIHNHPNNNQSSIRECTIIVSGKQKKSTQLSVNWEPKPLQASTVNASANVLQRNVFGACEDFHLSLQIPPNQVSHDFKPGFLTIDFSRPVIWNKNVVSLFLSAFHKTLRLAVSDSFQKETGLTIGFQPLPLISLFLETTHRISAPSRDAPPTIREESGSSFKASVKYIFTHFRHFSLWDYHFSFTQELAGLFGDTRFIKNSFSTLVHRRFRQDYELGLQIRGGGLTNLFGSRQNVSDRFFLDDIRGIPPSIVGPVENGKALGGNWFWLAAINLGCPLPFPSWVAPSIKGNVFFNAGNLVQSYPSFKETIRSLFGKSYSSVGYGFSIHLWNVLGSPRGIEFNFSYPVSNLSLQQLWSPNFGIHLAW